MAAEQVEGSGLSCFQAMGKQGLQTEMGADEPAGLKTEAGEAPRLVQVGSARQCLRWAAQPKVKREPEDVPSPLRWEAQWQQYLQTVQRPQLPETTLWGNAKPSPGPLEGLSSAPNSYWATEEGLAKPLPGLNGAAQQTTSRPEAAGEGGSQQLTATVKEEEEAAIGSEVQRQNFWQFPYQEALGPRGVYVKEEEEAIGSEVQRQNFRQFPYQEALGPRGVYVQLSELCRQWLEPEIRSKEQMLELVILEQFLAVLPPEMQSLVKDCGSRSWSHVMALLEDFVRRQQEAEGQEQPEVSADLSVAEGPLQETEKREVCGEVKQEDEGGPGSLVTSLGQSCTRAEEILATMDELGALDAYAVIIPPDVDEVTDEEDIDDGQLVLNDTGPVPREIVGTFEIHNSCEPETGTEPAELLNSARDQPSDGEPAPKHSRIPAKEMSTPTWKKAKPEFESLPENHEKRSLEMLEKKYGSNSPTDIASLFIDDLILTMLVEFSTKYARDKNNHDFSVTKKEMRKFIGILLLTGYHPLPQSKYYWSLDCDKGVPLVRETMPRNRFDEIKKFIYLSDSSKLDKRDKFCKVRPFFDELNKRFSQFGVFSYKLSIDEQMVPYFGQHSAKMSVRGKPIRFGFKLWCLASSDGYLYQFVPYAGASEVGKDGLGLGERVVLQLLDATATDPKEHEIFLVKCFSSYNLMSLLTDKGFYAAGAVRETYLMGCNILQNLKQMQKSPKGDYDYALDTKKNIFVARWRDNSVVTVISNFRGLEPISKVKRYNRKTKTHDTLPQPNVVREYNEGVGGVDVHDNAIASYRIGIRCKKWWWPLFINGIDSAVVNSWKFFRLTTKSTISQLDFKAQVALSFMQGELGQAEDDDRRQPPATCNIAKGRPSRNALLASIRYDGIGHLLIKNDSSDRRRCKRCKSQTIYSCKKCKVHVHAACFEEFHTQN